MITNAQFPWRDKMLPAILAKPSIFRSLNLLSRIGARCLTRGCIDIKSATKWQNIIFQISAEVSWLDKKGPAQLWTSLWVLIFKNPEVKPLNSLFFAEICKMKFCHFLTDVKCQVSLLLRHLSSASPAQKMQGLKGGGFHQFCRQHFISFWKLRWSMYIWVICPRNKFRKKT